MNCSCKVNQRRLTPGVFNLKQFLNGTETMIWELDNCIVEGAECDLRDFDAFLVLSVCGEVDEIMLSKDTKGDKLKLIWNVGTYATALTGHVKYQIVFRGGNLGQLGVIADDPEANGVYLITDETAAEDKRVFQRSGNGYQIKWDEENGRWALYNGETIVDYQTVPSTEPYCGVWGSVAVGSHEAAVWMSDEAIMYISDTIAADQTITAKYPTILRQMWMRMRHMIVKSGMTVIEKTITAGQWRGTSAPYSIDIDNIANGEIPQDCAIIRADMYELQADGSYTDVGNLRINIDAEGNRLVYALEKVAGKVLFTVQANKGFHFVSDDVLDNFYPVLSVNGKTGAVQLTAADLGISVTGASNAADVSISGDAEYYADTDVYTALQEIGGTLAGVENLLTAAAQTVEGI